MAKTLVLGCALIGSIFYIGTSILDETVIAAGDRQELRQVRADLF